MTRAERERESYWFFKKHGLCARCGKVSVFENETFCPECRVKRLEGAERYQKKHYRKHRENVSRCNKKRVEKLKEQGMCVTCGKRKAVPGKTLCEICLMKKRDDYRKRNGYQIPRHERKSYGLCYICGKELEDKNRNICKDCTERAIQNLPKRNEVLA